MSSGSAAHERDHLDWVCLYAMQTLPTSDLPHVEAQIAACADCQNDLETIRRVINSLGPRSAEVLQPPRSLWERLERRIGLEPLPPALMPSAGPPELEWEE